MFNTNFKLIWALSNISIDKIEYRDMCVKAGCIKKIINALQRFPHDHEILTNGISALFDFLSLPYPSHEDIPLIIPVVVENIITVKSSEILKDSLSVIANLSGNFTPYKTSKISYRFSHTRYNRFWMHPSSYLPYVKDYSQNYSLSINLGIVQGDRLFFLH